MRAHGVRSASLIAALLLGSAAALAQQAAPAVSVAVDDCVPVDHAKLNQLLAIELGTSTLQNGAAATHVEVSCGPRGIELRLEDAVTRKSMSRTLPASSFADASSTRLLALAVAEFVVASWVELHVQPEPAVQPVGPPPPPEARRVAANLAAEKLPARAAPQPERTLSLGPSVQLWSSHDAALFGATLRFDGAIAGPLAWSLSGDLGMASIAVALGDIELLTASAAIAAVLQLRADEITFRFGPGGRIGLARIDGEPADAEGFAARDFVAAYGGPIWQTGVEVAASTRVRVSVDLEAGLSTMPVAAENENQRPVFELDGVWITTALCVGLAF